jgi:hypothetical protein
MRIILCPAIDKPDKIPAFQPDFSFLRLAISNSGHILMHKPDMLHGRRQFKHWL